MIAYLKNVFIVTSMVFLLSGCVDDEVQEEGYVVAVSTTERKSGFNWVDLRMICKNTHCHRKRFYFSNEGEYQKLQVRAQLALGSNKIVEVTYKDYLLFDKLADLSINYNS